jgi:hypothetical protein
MSARDGVALRRKRELRQHEQTIEQVQKSFIEMGRALGKIKAEALYIVAGHKTFEEYLEARWDISPQHAYRLITAARSALILSPMGYKITSERVARELTPIADDQETLVAVYEEAQRRAPEGRVTAALVAEVRAELAPGAPVLDGEFTDTTDSQPAATSAGGDSPARPDGAPADQPSEPDALEGDVSVAAPGQPGHERSDAAGGDPPTLPAEPRSPTGVPAGRGEPEEGGRAPSSGDPNKVSRNEALGNWAKDSDEVRDAGYRKLVHKFLATIPLNLDDFRPANAAAAADPLLVEQIERVRDLFDSWADDVVQQYRDRSKPRLVRESA